MKKTKMFEKENRYEINCGMKNQKEYMKL
jgi:hypothetical protein